MISLPHANRSSALVMIATCVLLAGCRGSVGLSKTNPQSLVNEPGFDWAEPTTTEHFTIYAEVGSSGAAGMPVFRTDAENARTAVLQYLGQTRYDPRISVFQVETQDRMKALTGLSTNATSHYRTNLIVLVSGQLPPATVGHELVHVVAQNRWGVPNDWINEGLAVAYDGRVLQYPVHNLAKYLLDQGQLPSLEDLTKKFTSLPTRASYPAVGSFVSFLREQYGMAAVKQVYNEGAGGLKFATGVTADSLEQQWLERVRQADASGIEYRWD